MKFLIVIFFILSSCSFNSPVVETKSFDNFEFDLFMARGHAVGSDYERYVLKDDNLFFECGILPNPTLNAGQKKSEILEINPAVIPTKTLHRVRTLTSSELSSLHAKIFSLHESNYSFPAKESPYSMSKSGLLEFSASSSLFNSKFQTNLSSARKASPFKKAVVAFETIRGLVSNNPCNNTIFFGVERRAL